MTFLLCDPGWCVHKKSDVQHKWDDNTHTHPHTHTLTHMPRKVSKAVPEGNDVPVPQQKEFGSGQPTLADVYRMFKERSDQSDRYWYIISFDMRRSWTRWRKRSEWWISVYQACSKMLGSPTPCYGGRRASRHQDSRSYGGHRFSSSSDAWG